MMTKGNLGINIKRIGLISAIGIGMLLSLAACGGTADTGQTGEISAATATPAGGVMADTPIMTEVPSEAATATQVPADTGGSATATPASQGGQSGGTTTEVQGTLKEWAIDLSQKEV